MRKAIPVVPTNRAVRIGRTNNQKNINAVRSWVKEKGKGTLKIIK
jgi:hypothetical protein